MVQAGVEVGGTLDDLDQISSCCCFLSCFLLLLLLAACIIIINLLLLIIHILCVVQQHTTIVIYYIWKDRSQIMVAIIYLYSGRNYYDMKYKLKHT